MQGTVRARGASILAFVVTVTEQSLAREECLENQVRWEEENDMMVQVFIRRNELVSKMTEFGFKIGYEGITDGVLEAGDVILFNRGNTIILSSFRNGLLQNVSRVNADGRNRVPVYDTTLNTFYARLHKLVAMDSEVLPSPVAVFEDILFRRYDDNTKKSEAFVSAYSRLSSELQELFKKEYENLQQGQVPSVTFKQFDFFKSNDGKIFCVNDAVGNQYIISDLGRDDLTRITDVREMTSGRYMQIPMVQVLGEYSDDMKRVLQIFDYAFDPDWAWKCYGIKIPENRVGYGTQHEAYREENQYDHDLRFSIALGKTKRVTFTNSCLDIMVYVQDMHGHGRLDDNCYFELKEILEKNKEYVAQGLGGIIKHCSPLLYHLGLLDYLIDVANAYGGATGQKAIGSSLNEETGNSSKSIFAKRLTKVNSFDE